jgi:hypothetical protein
MTNNCILMGDFNLDWNLQGLHSYASKNYFRDMDEWFGEFNLVQVINMFTWSQIVQDVQIQSILDHVYSPNPLSIMDLKFTKPIFGDHLLVTFSFDTKNQRKQWPTKEHGTITQKMNNVTNWVKRTGLYLRIPYRVVGMQSKIKSLI